MLISHQNKKKTYLVTGGLGFIGSSLANTLQGTITVLSLSGRKTDTLKRKDITVRIKDINDITANDVENVDVIYHCAGTVHNYHVQLHPHFDTRVNIDGMVRLLEACKNLPQKPKVIFLSTFFVYGNEYERTKVPINENSPTDPRGLYPATKLCAESVLKLYSRLYAIPYVIARLTNVYGESERGDNSKKGALNYLIMKAVRGETIELYEGGEFYRDYIHVDDVVSALRFLEERGQNDTFLVGYGTPVKFRDMMEHILTLTGNKSQLVAIDPPFFHTVVGIKNFIADTKKINSLGWASSITWKDGLSRVVTAYQSFHQP